MGIGSVAAFADDRGEKSIHASTAWAFIDSDRANWAGRVDVLCDNIIHAFDCAFRFHALCAAEALFVGSFFRRLKKETDAPIKLFTGQDLRRTQCHGG